MSPVRTDSTRFALGASFLTSLEGKGDGSASQKVENASYGTAMSVCSWKSTWVMVFRQM